MNARHPVDDETPLGEQATPNHVVVVDIQGLRYPIRSALDPAYVHKLARYVERTMDAASSAVPIGESTKLAVLAALNIADEALRSRDEESRVASELVEKAAELERLIDAVLAKHGQFEI
ncbi:cell division protein ZapA [Luteitalea sp. TBR-22]|uniref:cell division protein ZapA n=1 Tax=Luteitalea sp. TBR-22 TaxID=2802971 RepID=UPI001EF4FEC8|nr:cell division protein ZapA [Luteitalea sp. TBR-22]